MTSSNSYPQVPQTVVDGHIHLWDTNHFEMAWLANATWLPDPVTLTDLQEVAKDVTVPHAIAVQAGSSLAEASWLAGHTDPNLAKGTPEIPRIVLQYEPDSSGWAGAVHGVVTEDSNKRIAGIRLPLQGAAEDWSDLTGLSTLFAGAVAHKLLIELLIRPDQLPTAARIARENPDVQFVLCHLGLSTGDPDDQWRSALTDFGRSPNTAAKISGLFRPEVELGRDDARVQEAVNAAVTAFGVERLMFGSDWPMSARIGSYEQVVQRTLHAFGEAAPATIDAVFGQTARRLYRL